MDRRRATRKGIVSKGDENKGIAAKGDETTAKGDETTGEERNEEEIVEEDQVTWHDRVACFVDNHKFGEMS